MKKILYCLTIGFFITATSVAVAAEKITVLLDWFLNSDHAPIFVAKQQGYFAKEQLDVEWIGPADPADPPKLVAAGQADIAVTYQPAFLEQVQQGLPLIQLGTLIDKPLNCLVVLQQPAIQTIADLKHKSIGYSGSSNSHAILKTMLEQQHLTLDDVTLINIHYDLTQALLSGKVDAVIGMMRNVELTQIELTGAKARAFYPEDYGVPQHSELIFVVNSNQKHDPRYQRFLRALTQGVTYLQRHPVETWHAFATANPELDNELNRRAWLATAAYFAKQPATIDSSALLHFATFMQKNGMLETVQPLSHYIITKD